MSNSNYWSTYIIIILLIIMGSVFAYYTMANNAKLAEESKQQTEKKVASIVTNEIEAVETKIEEVASTSSESVEKEDDWKKIYPITQDLQIKDIKVQASVARTWADRIKGLSETPYLPENVVKLFIFDSLGEHSIWMKDMNYDIDIIWIDADNKIVDIKKNATPESFPEAFSPRKEALYVIETKAGFVDKNNIKINDEVFLPKED